MKKANLLIMIFLLSLILAFPPRAQAFENQAGNIVKTEKDRTIQGNFYAAGNSIFIEGKINGDLICAAQNLVIKGTVEGDVICFSSSINISGKVKGNLRLAGGDIYLSGNTEKGAQIIGNEINFAAGSRVGGDALLAGAKASLEGEISGDLHGSLAVLRLDGKIGKNVKFKFNGKTKEKNPLFITEAAEIGGNVFYTADKKGQISPKADIGGEIGYGLPDGKTEKKDPILSFWFKIISIFSALVLGLAYVSLAPKTARRVNSILKTRPAAALLSGSIALFLAPLLSLLLAFTIIGLPLALLVLCFWLAALYISKILVGIMIGGKLLEKLRKKNDASLISSMIMGVAIIWFLSDLPVLGFFISLSALLWGLGGIWLFGKKTYQEKSGSG